MAEEAALQVRVASGREEGGPGEGAAWRLSGTHSTIRMYKPGRRAELYQFCTSNPTKDWSELQIIPRPTCAPGCGAQSAAAVLFAAAAAAPCFSG